MRIIVFSGKGGAGVSTLAAATAVYIARAGKRTLAFGLGTGLSAAFEVPLTYEPTEVTENLEALEARGGRDAPDEARDWLADFLSWRDMESGLAEDIAALPGMNRVGQLLQLEGYVATGDYDVVALEGGALEQFLDLPPALDAAARWLERLFAPRQQNVFEPFVRVFAGDYASTGEEVFERGRDLLRRLAGLRDLLQDADVSSVRLILNPTGIALADAQEALPALSLFSYALDALILNCILPDEVNDPFLDDIRARQDESLQSVTAAVTPTPVLKAALARQSPRGVASLAALAHEVYGDRQGDDILHREVSHTLSQEGGHYVMSITLPFARRGDVSLAQVDGGVEVWLNGRRCMLSLPDEVLDREAASWSYEAPWLKVTFR